MEVFPDVTAETRSWSGGDPMTFIAARSDTQGTGVVAGREVPHVGAMTLHHILAFLASDVVALLILDLLVLLWVVALLRLS